MVLWCPPPLLHGDPGIPHHLHPPVPHYQGVACQVGHTEPQVITQWCCGARYFIFHFTLLNIKWQYTV